LTLIISALLSVISYAMLCEHRCTKSFSIILQIKIIIIMSEREEHPALTVRRGNKFKIELQSNPSTGYSWHLLFYNKNILKLLSSEFEAKTENQIGTAGKQRFNFEATKKGTTSIKLVYKRAWEISTMKSKEFSIKVL
jgi:inhibitor of cysteine peptidase